MFSICPHCDRMVLRHSDGAMPKECPYCRKSMAAKSADVQTVMPRPEASTPPKPSQTDKIPAEDRVAIDPPVAAATGGASTTTVDRDDAASSPDPDPETPTDDAAMIGIEAEPAQADDAEADKPAQPSTTPVTATAPTTGHQPPPTPIPSFSRSAPATRDSRLHWLVVVLLAGLLGLQWLLVERDALAADTRWRPMLETVCTPLPCQLPAWHEPSALRMLERDVRTDPARPGLLRVHARFRNNARWPQAWPRLQLQLTNSAGQTVAGRVFTPAQYLGQPPAPGQRIEPGQEAIIAFDVVEPGGETLAFGFVFK